MKSYFNNGGVVLVICLSLGLAPFTPEPHIWGKLKWIMGGGVGMGMMDWLDFAFHGTPWALLIRYIVLKGLGKI